MDGLTPESLVLILGAFFSPILTVIGLILTHRLELMKIKAQTEMRKEKRLSGNVEETDSEYAAIVDLLRVDAAKSGNHQIEALIEVVDYLQSQIAKGVTESIQLREKFNKMEADYNATLEENKLLKQEVEGLRNRIRQMEIQLEEKDALD